VVTLNFHYCHSIIRNYCTVFVSSHFKDSRIMDSMDAGYFSEAPKQDEETKATLDETSLRKPRKKLILIRHAESQNNVAKNETRAAWKNMKTLQGFPSVSQLCSAGSLLTVPMDTDLSPDGEVMVNRLCTVMSESNFIAEHGIELVIHSHLIRAARTCGLLFRHTDIPIEENELVYEKNISEHLRITDMKRRIDEFIRGICARPETCLVIVGHSAFFRDMLDTDLKMKNCEVRECFMTIEDGAIHDIRILVEGGESLLTDNNDHEP
jgi:broad specificity phosphatase PhoE